MGISFEFLSSRVLSVPSGPEARQYRFFLNSLASCRYGGGGEMYFAPDWYSAENDQIRSGTDLFHSPQPRSIFLSSSLVFLLYVTVQRE